MIRTQVLLTEEQHRFLTEEARTRGVSLSELIRRLVEEKRSLLTEAQRRGAEEMAREAVEVPSETVHHNEVLYR
ncbi:MAG TPA: ribbon-helix-helix protein, CopG family [Desulfotomaculum sp.]|nr:ribbon-helix-helix protein, CopG family [Desulfotomaculum sp.]